MAMLVRVVALGAMLALGCGGEGGGGDAGDDSGSSTPVTGASTTSGSDGPSSGSNGGTTEDGGTTTQDSGGTTDDGATTSAPEITEAIAYARWLGDERDIYLIEPGAAAPRQLTFDPASDKVPQWVAVSMEIVFVSDRGSHVPSPDGLWVAYTHDEAGGGLVYQLRVAALDGSSDVAITPGTVVSPTWSPDSGSLAFHAGSPDDIYVIPRSGGTAVNITDSASEDRDPHWSPVGDAIVFTSDRDGSRAIYRMSSDGSGQEALTAGPLDRGPRWSPDGTRIAFIHQVDTQFSLMVIDADGSNEADLDPLLTSFVNVAWSPASDYLVYSRELDEGSRLFYVHVDGGAPVRLTDDDLPDYEASPSWGPIP
jgi:TolB protein